MSTFQTFADIYGQGGQNAFETFAGSMLQKWTDLGWGSRFRLQNIADGLFQDFQGLISSYQAAFTASSQNLAASIGRAEGEYRTSRDATLAGIDRNTASMQGRSTASMAARGLGSTSMADAAANEIGLLGEQTKGQVREQYGAGLANLIMQGGSLQSSFDEGGARTVAGLRANAAQARASLLGQAEGVYMDAVGNGIGAWGNAMGSYLDRAYGTPMVQPKKKSTWDVFGAGLTGAGVGAGGGALAGAIAGTVIFPGVGTLAGAGIGAGIGLMGGGGGLGSFLGGQ